MEQTNLWLAFWCDFLGALLVVATCLFSVAFSETLGAPNVGLAISNSIQVLVFFTWVVRGVADTVSMWDAIERVTSFATQVGARHKHLWTAVKLLQLSVPLATSMTACGWPHLTAAKQRRKPPFSKCVCKQRRDWFEATS
jgi:ABC-type enterochelin transport system permease subunit